MTFKEKIDWLTNSIICDVLPKEILNDLAIADVAQRLDIPKEPIDDKCPNCHSDVSFILTNEKIHISAIYCWRCGQVVKNMTRDDS